jgi:hypothetical protein
MNPEKVFRHGNCFASVFLNEIEKNGTIRHIRTVMFAKRYLDNGEWQTTNCLSVNDIPTATLVLNKAYEYLTAIAPTVREEE